VNEGTGNENKTNKISGPEQKRNTERKRELSYPLHDLTGLKHLHGLMA